MTAALTSALALACGADYAPYTGDDGASEFGSTEAAVAACEGDDLQYDFNAFSASLAVAIANEIQRWDVLADFEVRNGKLELSQTGLAHCGSSDCNNITALLRLQDDVTSGVPYHSPSVYRSKLVGWYNAQEEKLVELATAGTQSEGTYRVVSRMSNKRMAVEGGSMNDNAPVETWDRAPRTGADEWRLTVSGTKHKLVNARSGKCLDLRTNSSATGIELVQKSCSSADTQLFELQRVEQGFVGLINKYGKAAEVKWWSSNNGTSIITANWQAYEANKAWKLEAVGGGATQNSSQDGVPNGMYSLVVRHTGKAIGVEGDPLAEGSRVAQRTYDADTDKFHWYISKVGDRYQLVNRGSGKCLALLSGETMGQKTCANVDSQKFSFERITNGEEHFAIRAPNGKTVMIKDYGLVDGSPLVLMSGNPTDLFSRQFRLNDILAGEPHRLEFSHVTDNGPCGDYYWYDISQPNGLPLTAPEESFVQLMFAGGKSTLNGEDQNPFIAQQVSGTLVAIDPSGYMTGGTSSQSGSCIASDIFYDDSMSAAGNCCIRYNGRSGVFQRSSWSARTFLCR